MNRILFLIDSFGAIAASRHRATHERSHVSLSPRSAWVSAIAVLVAAFAASWFAAAFVSAAGQL